MTIGDLPKWMNVIPTLVGVGLAFLGIAVFPHSGIRNVWGPIIGLPVGMVIGVAILAKIAKDRS